ncbi:MAG: hypothetical protein V4737_15385 [Curtobacterium sp.]
MRLREIDAGGWLRVAGGAVIAAVLAGVFAATFPIASWLAVGIGAGSGAATLVLIVAAWAGAGGYSAHRALRDWVRGGPEPDRLPSRQRVRYLSGVIDRTGWYAWGGVVFSVAFLLLGVSDVLGEQDLRRAVLMFGTALVWGVVAVHSLTVERPHRERAQELYEAQTDAAD